MGLYYNSAQVAIITHMYCEMHNLNLTEAQHIASSSNVSLSKRRVSYCCPLSLLPVMCQ